MRVFAQPEGPVDLSAAKVPEPTEWGGEGRQTAVGGMLSIPLCSIQKPRSYAVFLCLKHDV